ncbi:MAG: hypothetical protein U0S36_10770 [Candidatus Nanopelagicales bacterium]
MLSFVRTAEGTVRVPTSALAGVVDGATVRVDLASTDGVRLTARGAASLTPGVDEARDPEAGADVSAVEVLAQPAAGTVDVGTTRAAAPAATAGAAAPHQVTVVLARPSNGTAPSVSVAQVAAAVSGEVSSYWSTVTRGAVSFTTTTYPSVVTTASTPCVNQGVGATYDFWDEVAATVGWTQGPGKHLVVYFEDMAACGSIAGLGTLGSGPSSGGMLWTNGHTSTGVIGHELGHNLGLGHSQELDCTYAGTRIMDAPPASCTRRSYWDTNDIMAVSWWNQGFLNASHLRRLGVLEAGAEVAPTTSTTVSLKPLAGSAGQRVLTLASGADRYVVEYRAATGLDSWMATEPGWGAPGVTVRREFDQKSVPSGQSFPLHESFLLDGDPATDDPSFGHVRTVVPVGTWMGLAGGSLGIRVTSQSAAGAVVEVRVGSGSPLTPVMSAKGGVTAAVLSTPYAAVRTGPVAKSRTTLTVPVRWHWVVQAGAARLVQSRDRTLVMPVSGVGSAAYQATAASLAGTAVSPTGTARARYVPESGSAAVRYAKAWKAARSAGAVGSSVRRTTAARGKVSITVTGRSIGVLLQRGRANGRAAVYLDGRRVAVVNLRASSTSTRIAWASSLSTSRSHTVTVVNMARGTRLGFDGVVAIA